MPRDVRGVPGPRAGAGGGGALQGGRAERGDQAAEYWGPAQIPRSVLDMHSRYLYSTRTACLGGIYIYLVHTVSTPASASWVLVFTSSLIYLSYPVRYFS